MRELTVDMDGIVDAMIEGPDDGASWLDLESGEIVYVPSDLDAFDCDEELRAEAEAVEEDPKRFAQVPRLESRDQYDLMQRWAEALEEDDVRERLLEALDGKGAFGRFRACLSRYPDLSNAWFDVLRAELVVRAERWLREERRVAPKYTLRVIERTRRSVSRKSKQPEVTLLDMLLLGAPDGKTELLGGKVRRVLLVPSADRARQVWKRLARELCAFYGEEWRNRFIEGASTIERGRMRLTVLADRVELEIQMSVEVFAEFG